MKYNGRKKENIKNTLIVLIGIVCLYCITMNLRNIEASTEMIELEEIEGQNVIIEEKNIELDIDNLYESMGQAINEEEISRVVIQVLGESYLPEVEIDSKEQSYGVIITYDETNKEQSLSKVKKEQVALVDACLLMSLFNDIDVVTIRNIRGETYEEKVIYRPDLEDYFGISLRTVDNKNTFARIANEFLSSEAVSSYWNMKHPYDSNLGEAVEKFYKYNFPSDWKIDEALPYIDETLGSDLAGQYGYKFFIQGLNYEHPLMNYYAAYRLIEYYGNSNIDEILLELASCKNKSSSEEVKAACTFVMNVLSSRLEEDEVIIFTRYSESEFQGGKKLYGLVGEKLVEIATWQGEEPGGFEVISVSSNKKSVLCKIHTLGKSYLYMIPIDTTGGYVVNETAVQKGEQIISREITNLMKEVALNEEMDSKVLQDIDAGAIQSRWLLKNVLILSIRGEESFVYDGNKDSLLSEDAFSQRFNTDYLVEGLKEKFDTLTEKEMTHTNEKYQVKEITIHNEKIIVYEYDNKMQKNIELLKEKQQENQVEKQWSKGKIYVTYSGDQTDIINTLNMLMAE